MQARLHSGILITTTTHPPDDVMTFSTRPLRQLPGHNGPVHCITYSAGLGQYALTGCSDRLVRLFNPATAALVQAYDGHGHSVLDVAVTADNARFASVGGDRAVFVWDVAAARTIRRYGGHEGRVNAVAWGGDGDGVVISGGFDKTVRLWDTRAQGVARPLLVLDDARDSVAAVALLGHEIAAASVDGRVRLYDLRMGMVYVDVVGQPVTCVRHTKDGAALLVSTLDSTLRLLDKADGKLLQAYRGHTNTEYRVRACLARNDAFVVAGSEDGKIFVWDLLEGEVVTMLDGHGGKVASAVAVNDARKEWISAGVDGTVQVWGLD